MTTRRSAVFVLGLAVALAGLALIVASFRPRWAREDPDAVRREIVSLTRTRDSLRALVFEQALASDLLDGRPAGDIVIGLPTPFVNAIVRNMVTGWFHEVDVRLPSMRIRKSGTVKAKLGILGRRTVGEFVLDLTLDDVRGRLEPGDPTMTFGGNKILLSVPVDVVTGTGVARVTAGWVSTGVTSPVCGNMTVTRDVTGKVRARRYIARGSLTLSAVGGVILADPKFPALAIRLFVDPSRKSVAVLDSILASRGGLCGVALRRSRASERVQAIVARGFTVTIPQRFFRPIRLPVSIETSVPVQNRKVGLRVSASALVVTRSTAWIAASVSMDAPSPARP